MSTYVALLTPDTEDLVDAVTTCLQAYLPAVLSAIGAKFSAADTARYGAQIDLDAPLDDSYHAGDAGLVENFPMVIIDASNTKFHGKGTYSRNQGHDETTAVSIDVYLVDDTDTKVSRKLWRYARAISQVLQEHPDLDLEGKVKGGLVTSAEYGRGVHEKTGTLFRYATILVEYLTLTDSNTFVTVP